MRSNYYKPRKQQNLSFYGEAEKSQRETMRAWECFVEHGHANEEVQKSVRSEILASWMRCSNSGVSALCNATPQKVDENDIYLLRRKNRSLCEAAGPAFERLAPHLKGTGAILILTDQTGTVIETIGDSKTLDAGREIQLEVGGVWDERVIGTNGIGTALRTGMPTYVHASEHFAQGIKSWTCVGVPIIDALDRSVIGVVDLSGPSGIYRPHNVALVVATAREIELNLAERHRQEHTLLLEEFIDIPQRLDSDSAIVLLNSTGKIVYSRVNENMANGAYGDLRIGAQLLDFYPGMSVGDLTAALPATLNTENIDLIKAGGKTQGVALILRGPSVKPSKPSGKLVSFSPRQGISEDVGSIVGQCPKILEAIEFARRAAEKRVAVLIQGETGVGKELFARLIHSHHANSATPYVVINCATLSADMIRNELFGHVGEVCSVASCKGKLGKFEQANDGVLCLDEVGDMPAVLQTFFLRTIEQRAVYRIGSDVRRAIDVQLIAMTSRNIAKDIKKGRFRQDLFYRIGTIVIELPPLRERGQDIIQLIDFFNQKLAKKYARNALLIDEEAIAALHTYHWPGNVRELRNIVERLYLQNQKDLISITDLPEEMRGTQTSRARSKELTAQSVIEPVKPIEPMDLEAMESAAVQRSIDLHNGNLTKVAASLGISRPTLYRKIKQYGLQRKR